MSGALNSVFGGNGGLLGAVGGLIGEAIGGPLGEMIGQALGNMLQQAIGDALKGGINELVQQHGMPSFLGDMLKDKVDQGIDSVTHHNVPAEAQQLAQDHYGSAMQDFQSKLQQQFVQNVVDQMRGEGAEDSKGASKGGTGGWLQAIAKYMGKMLGDKAAHMVDLSHQMSELKTSGSGNAQQDQANAQQFNKLMTDFQATSQEYSILQNAFSTAIKSVGEAMSGMARKQ